MVVIGGLMALRRRRAAARGRWCRARAACR
ncbi:MAG: hypothetical protein ACPF9W_12560 [Nocardioides sp.]